ncbi:MAG: TIGR02281 family clan AA aspartic protease [Zoogloeaceae bacterium]|nr:TIGR02281 family clan AA aspartic protease [Zoogloeaceae bacterium]
MLCLLAPVCLSAVAAESVGLAGVIGNKALITIDGAPPRAMKAGQEAEGVKLVSISNGSVVVEVGGARQALRVGQNAVGSASRQAPSVRLQADANGHFSTEGRINGVLVQFLVDTGATWVAMDKAESRRLGIDLSGARQGMTQTANGNARVWLIKLDTVQLGTITLRDVDCAVLEQPMPQILLGMSFLNQTNMRREGDVLTLIKRF